jgi:hypothetical protein
MTTWNVSIFGGVGTYFYPVRCIMNTTSVTLWNNKNETRTRRKRRRRRRRKKKLKNIEPPTEHKRFVKFIDLFDWIINDLLHRLRRRRYLNGVLFSIHTGIYPIQTWILLKTRSLQSKSLMETHSVGSSYAFETTPSTRFTRGASVFQSPCTCVSFKLKII